MSLPQDILSVLQNAGLVQGTAFSVSPLGGGVSCDIWRVEDGPRVFAVKRALPKLRVQAEWYADVSRNRHEQEYLRYVAGFLPHAVPKILLAAPDLDFFAMEFLGGGFSNWKKSLLAGKTDPSVAATAGFTLGRIHRESWLNSGVGNMFNTDSHFHDLRVAPYLLASAEKHPDLAPFIITEANRLLSTKRALVHGDFSPKNLMIAPGRFVVLDCEVAWFGDPAFDVCFLVCHLLLKSLHMPEKAEGLLKLVFEMLSAYRAELGADKFNIVSRDSPALLLCLLLARVDGKSPVEYLADHDTKTLLRKFVGTHLPHIPEDLSSFLSLWALSVPK